ncbi:hypothetical protein K440DRAFT_563787 [Wilcoxina mikolae CBS 423.85]|nr:hypothetical protein K440DRAFT_563787 [Wilcoxina mikolae CBS 423.85]
MSLDHRNILQWISESRDSSEDGHPHLSGYGSKWFGVTITHSGVSLDTTSRYRELSIDVNSEHEQYPSLISFVGETGAGKSTIINALIKFLDRSKRIQTPVIGHPRHLNTPTSGDVHLFADPSTGDSERPYLYADCEGMDGGSKIPVGVRAVSRVKRLGILGELKSQRFKEIRLKWAKGEQKTRQTLHKVISRLISWADTVFQTSVNQPMLPYAIIVVNALEDEVCSPYWWNDNLAQKELSENVEKFVETNSFIWGLIEQWRERDKEIVTLQDLVLCYYSGIQIICIPHTKYSNSPSVLITQYNNLHKAISTATTVTRQRRREAELLMNSEELDIYLGYAFDHFSINPDIPFNFLSAAFHHNPVRQTFKTHILRTAICFMNIRSFDSGAEIFHILAPLVASSILLDVCRKSYPQKYNAAEEVIKEYEPLCREAIQEFYKGYWPCSYVDSKGRCVNVSTKHQKGHQIVGGRVVAAGSYVHERYYHQNKSDGMYFIEEVAEQYQRQLLALINQGGHPMPTKTAIFCFFVFCLNHIVFGPMGP